MLSWKRGLILFSFPVPETDEIDQSSLTASIAIANGPVCGAHVHPPHNRGERGEYSSSAGLKRVPLQPHLVGVAYREHHQGEAGQPQ